MEQEHIQPFDVVDPRRHAILDPKLRMFVNYEVFYFASDSTKAVFERDPTRWCGLVTDPVTQQRFRPPLGAKPREYMGRPYFFATDSSQVAFEAAPDSFAVRKGM